MRKVTFAFLLLSLSSCHFYRSIVRNFPDVDDHRFFHSRTINPDKSPFQFTNYTNSPLGSQVMVIPKGKTDSIPQSLDNYVDSSRTVAFLIIKNDSILYEKYSKGHTAESLITTFSAVKSILSLLIGIAINDGLIENVNDPITKYLPEFHLKEGFDSIKIRHLLQMRSGIKESKILTMPSSQPLRFYYGKDLDKQCYNLKIDTLSGGKFRYSYASNTQLLGMLLREVTGKNLSVYFEEKIWSKVGTSSPAYWDLDKKDGMEKAFCCFNAKARDIAKIAKLLLQKGKWDGEQIVPEWWIDEITKIEHVKEYNMKKELPNKEHYNMHWWVGTKGRGDYEASGMYGQTIKLFPKENMTMLVFTKRRGWTQGHYQVDLFYQIMDQLNF